MTKRSRGQPKLTEDERAQRANETRRALTEEMFAEPTPARTVAIERVAKRLGVSKRTVMTRLADVTAQRTPDERQMEANREVEEVLRKYVERALAAAHQAR